MSGFTTVTAIIKDSSSNIYTNARVVATLDQSFLPAGSGPPLLAGRSVFSTFEIAITDSFGNLTLTLADVNQITPPGCVWDFTVVNNTGLIGFTLQNQVITGATQDISAALQAVAAPLNPAAGNITPLSVTSPRINNTYYVDGIVNTTIQQAINQASAAGGGLVIVPPGTYPQSATLTIPSNIVLLGSGWDTLLTVTRPNFDVIQNSDQVNGNSNIFIIGIKVDGTGGLGSGVQRPIYFQKVTNFEVASCFLTNMRTHGILMENGCFQGSIHHCRIDTNQVGTGIELGNGPIAATSVVNDIRIESNYVANTAADGIFCLGASTAGQYGTSGIVVTDNDVVSPGDTAIEIGVGCQNCTVTGNRVKLTAAGTTGITGRSVRGCAYQNNTVVGNNSAMQTAYLLWNQAGDNTINQNCHMGNNVADSVPIAFKMTCPASGLDNGMFIGNKQFNCATPYSFSGNETNVYRIGNDDGVFQLPASAPFLIDATNAQPRVQKNGDVAWWFRNTAQSVSAGGLWRLSTNGTSLELDMNNAAGGDFSSFITALQFDNAGDVIFAQNKAVFAGLAGFEVRNGLLGKWFSDGGATLKAQIDGSTGNAIFGSVTPSQTAGIVGTNTNNSANAGSVGEFISATLASGSSISLSTGTPANVISISLTAGDWDVSGSVAFTFGATTSVTNLIGSISTTSATHGGLGQTTAYAAAANVPTAAVDEQMSLPMVRLSLAGTTTVFLVASGGFTVSTLKAYGVIRARRVR